MLALRLPPTSCVNAISKEENDCPEVALIEARDFNTGKLSTIMLHVQPGEKKNLHHLYFTHRDAYKARPPFGKSDHTSILLIPA